MRCVSGTAARPTPAADQNEFNLSPTTSAAPASRLRPLLTGVQPSACRIHLQIFACEPAVHQSSSLIDRMIDYTPLLTRAIAALESNTRPSRAALYLRVRSAQLKNLTHGAFTESAISLERLSLERAIRDIELQKQAKQQSGRAGYRLVSAPQPAPPMCPSAPRAKRNTWVITTVVLFLLMNITGATVLWLLMHLMSD